MREYRIFFKPTFHDDVVLTLEIDGDYGIISLKSNGEISQRDEISENREVTLPLLRLFNENVKKTNPLFIPTHKSYGLDGMIVDCCVIDDGLSNEFSVWSPRGNDYQEHLIFINSIYNLARKIFTDERTTTALDNLRHYFDEI
jgi:hypothetical protein